MVSANRPSIETSSPSASAVQAGCTRFIITVAAANAHRMTCSGPPTSALTSALPMCSPSRKYAAKHTAAPRAIVTPSPSSVMPCQTWLTTASPPTASTSAGHIRGCTCSRRANRTQSTTSTGPRYSSSSAMLSGSRLIATLYVHCTPANPAMPRPVISHNARPRGTRRAERSTSRAISTNARNAVVMRTVVNVSVGVPPRSGMRDTPALRPNSAAASSTRG